MDIPVLRKSKTKREESKTKIVVETLRRRSTIKEGPFRICLLGSGGRSKILTEKNSNKIDIRNDTYKFI